MHTAITAADLADGMTIEHKGSHQHFTVRDVARRTPGITTWNGTAAGSRDGHLHSFNAPDNWPLVLVAQPPTVTPEPPVKVARTPEELRKLLADVLKAFEPYHQNDTAGRPWLAAALAAVADTSAPVPMIGGIRPTHAERKG